MDGFVDKIIDVLLALVIFSALFGVIITTGLNPTAFSWKALNFGGTVYDFSWAPYIIGIMIIIGVVYLVYRYFLKNKK
jgi:hypothetical protein